MTDASQLRDNDIDDEVETRLEQAGFLGTSPAGESYEIIRTPAEREFEDDHPPVERFVLKKLTRARVRSPEDFRQKFAALCRLDHDNLCPYRELFIGERATRVTRDFVEGIPLDEYLLQPITDEEREQLEKMTGHTADGSPDDESDLGDRAGDETNHEADDEVDARQASEQPDEHSESAADITEPTADDERIEAETDDKPPEDRRVEDDEDDDRPSTLEIPAPLLDDEDAANRALDLIMLRLRRIVPKLIDALEYLHRFRQVHGNLTPSNILVTPDDEPILTDYGLHPELYIPPDARQRHQSYHAPEVTRGQYRPESDLYALGAMLFEALADRPYGARRRRDTPDEPDAEYTPVYLSEIAPHCPATWVDLIHAMLTPEPEDRPSLDEIHRQLAATETRSVNIPASVVEDPETLYGRRESLDRLMDTAQQCSQKRRLAVATVEGETGVGKTAVLDAMARRAAQRGWVVLHGKCFHREPVAYQGWERVVGRMATIADNLPDKPRRRLREGRHRASRIFPQLAPDDQPRPEVGRRAAVQGFRHVLTELSEQRPILICFDDIHWAGWDSTRLLADLAEDPDGLRLMVAASWRPDAQRRTDRQPFWTEIETAPVEVDRVTIEGFSKDDAREYVLTHATNLSLRQKQKVLRRSGLNPLLIDELIHELEEDTDQDSEQPDAPVESTDPADEQPRRDRGDDQAGDDLDHFLRQFIEERIQQLDRSERLILQLLAIASGPLDPELLARAMDRELGAQTGDLVSGREVAELLVERRLARRARRIEPSTGDHSPRYVVVHDLARDVVLDELGRDHHARLCGLIADALASGSDQNDDLRFEYLLRAGRGQEASRAAVLAARTAIDRFAYNRATRLWKWLDDREQLDERDRPDFARALLGAGHFSEAIEEFDRLPSPPSRRIELQRRRQCVQAHLSAGDRPGAIETLDETMRAASTPYLNRSLGDVLGDLRRKITAALGRWTDAASVATDDPPDEQTRSRAELYDFALRTAPFLRSEPSVGIERRFARIAARSRFGPLLARDRLWMIGAPWLPFLVRDAAKHDRWADQATELADRFDDPEARARSLEIGALLARHRGNLQTAAERTNRARQLVEVGEVSAPLLYARLLALRADTTLLRGELDWTHQIVDRFVHRFRHRRWLSSFARLTASDRALLTGNLQQAHDHIESIRRFVGDDRNCLLHVWMMARRTRLCIARDQPEVAVGEWDLLVDQVYSRTLRRRPRARALLHFNLGAALGALAARQEALDEPHLRESMRRLRRTIRRLGDLESWMGRFDRSRLFRLRSRYKLLRDRVERARELAREAASVAGDDPPALVAAMNRETLGWTTLPTDRSEGRTHLREARDQYDEIGVYLPLVLEGWPVPPERSRLAEKS